MKSIACLVLLLTAFAAVVRGADTRVKCSAFGALKIKQSGSGSCAAQVSASCASIATAQDSFKEAYEFWFAEGENPCEEARVEAAASAMATAVAKIYADANTRVHCSLSGRSKGFACGYSTSQGSAMAAATARAVAQAAVDVSVIDGDSFCIADVEVAASGIAEACASAQSRACVKGSGSSEDFQKAVVESVTNILAEAFTSAAGKTCSAEGAAAAAAECTGKTLADVRSEVKAEATETAAAAGTSEEVPPCGHSMDKCCANDYKGFTCSSKDPETGASVRWRMKSGKRPKIWQQMGSSRVKCACYTHPGVV